MIPTIRNRLYQFLKQRWRSTYEALGANHICQPCTSSFSSSQVILPSEAQRRKILTSRRPFAVLDREVRAKAVTINQEYQLIDIKHRLPILDDEEWRIYLSTLGSMYLPDYMHFGYDQTENMFVLIEKIAPFCERLAPIDFCNYLRFVDSFDVENGLKNHIIWDWSVLSNISRWFLKRYESLERGAFFQILKLKTTFLGRSSLLFNLENTEEVARFLEHGVHLLEQPESDICDCLFMLSILRAYGRTAVGENSNPFIATTLDLLTAKDYPNSLDDFHSSLKFICDDNPRKKRFLFAPEFGLQSHARRNKEAWQWLRNSIELIFEDDNFEHLRPSAAAAAVRTFLFKAIDFTPEQVNSYLSIAAEPYLKNPAIVFEPQKSEVHLPNRRLAFGHLICAVYAAVFNFYLRSSLEVRFDQAYWTRFFDMLWEETPKLSGLEGAALFREMRCALYPLNALKVQRAWRHYFETPVNARREEQLDIMKKKYRLKVFNVVIDDVMASELDMLMHEEHTRAINKSLK